MTVDLNKVRFLVDESLLGIGKTLESARSDTIYIGHPKLPELPKGTLDPVWIEYAAKHNLTVFGRDKKVRTRPGENDAIREHGLRVFRLVGNHEAGTWGDLKRLVRWWEAIEKLLEEQPEGPWFYRILHTGLKQSTLDPLDRKDVDTELVPEPSRRRDRRAPSPADEPFNLR